MSFTGAELLSNDVDPQGERWRSWRSRSRRRGVLSGLAAGFVYTPCDEAALVGTDYDSTIWSSIPTVTSRRDGRIRILAAGDPNRPPVTEMTWRERVRDGAGVALGNDFDPDGDGFGVVGVDPAHGAVSFSPNFVNYTPDAGFSGMESVSYGP